MKIAILTMQGFNYGNRLQNYALQSVLETRGHTVASLRREAGLQGSWKSKLFAVRCEASMVLKHRSDRLGAFRRFDRSFIRFSNMVVSKELVSRDLPYAYDCFVIGSDQVWNPDFSFNSELDYLPMVPKAKKLSYAASFGVSEIHDDRAHTAALLDDIASVSVREGAGADIVRSLTGRKVPVVLDPTLLLTPEDWERVGRRPAKVDVSNRPYVFKYVLGDDVNGRRIAELASSHGLEIVDVMDESLGIGPSEFAWLIAHSELVCTDSFHASVFALLHHKPLAIFERVSDDADMSSRFDTLCCSFGLVGHRSSETGFGEEAIYGTDWDDFEARLGELREDSERWLDDALEGVARA